MLEPGVTGAWSVRDIIAHVTSWDEEALKHLPLVLKGGKPRVLLDVCGIDEFNALMTEQKKDLSLPEVMRQMNDTHLGVLNLIESAPESQIKGETRYRQRTMSSSDDLLLRLRTRSSSNGSAQSL